MIGEVKLQILVDGSANTESSRALGHPELKATPDELEEILEILGVGDRIYDGWLDRWHEMGLVDDCWVVRCVEAYGLKSAGWLKRVKNVEVMEKFAKKTTNHFLVPLARNPHLPDEIQKRLADKKKPGVIEALVSNPNMAPIVAEYAYVYMRDNSGVRAMANAPLNRRESWDASLSERRDVLLGAWVGGLRRAGVSLAEKQRRMNSLIEIASGTNHAAEQLASIIEAAHKDVEAKVRIKLKPGFTTS